MKIGVIACLTTFVLGCVLFLLQMWVEPFSAAVYSKVMITLGVVFVVLLGVTLVRREYLSEDALRKSGHLQ